MAPERRQSFGIRRVRGIGALAARVGGTIRERLPLGPLRPVVLRPTGEGTPPIREAEVRPGVRRLIVSDLHLGQGNRADDFSADAELAAFVADYASAEPTELILGGDTFELLQVRVAGIREDEWSGAAAAARLRAIFVAHPQPVAALRAFVARPGCQLSVVIGNHDFELHYAAAQHFLREALDASAGEQVRFGTSYAGGGIYFVHGNQFDAWNRFVYFDGICEPFEVVRGTLLVKEVINQLEDDPLAQATLIDNVKPVSAFAWHLLALQRLRDPQVRRFVARSLAMTSRALARAHRYTLARDARATIPSARATTRRWRLHPGDRAASAIGRLRGRSVAEQPAREVDDQIRSEARAVRSHVLRGMAALADSDEHRRRTLFACGHTHLAHTVVLSERQTYINTGTWTEVVLEIASGRRQEQRYPFLEVTYPDEPDTPHGALLVWQETGDAPQPWKDERPAGRQRAQEHSDYHRGGI
jgi:UDP-2,3-diacylglucosamine pyrophosphatase LpxH